MKTGGDMGPTDAETGRPAAPASGFSPVWRVSAAGLVFLTGTAGLIYQEPSSPRSPRMYSSALAVNMV